MKGELEKRQSEVIAAMRFPLMVLLLFAHVLPMVSVPIEMNLSEMNIYHFISEGISHNLSRIRNPLFFFFSVRVKRALPVRKGFSPSSYTGFLCANP